MYFCRSKGGKIFRVKVETFSCEAKRLVGKNAKRGRVVGAKSVKEEHL
jgi:hypothetical protein